MVHVGPHALRRIRDVRSANSVNELLMEARTSRLDSWGQEWALRSIAKACTTVSDIGRSDDRRPGGVPSDRGRGTRRCRTEGSVYVGSLARRDEAGA